MPLPLLLALALEGQQPPTPAAPPPNTVSGVVVQPAPTEIEEHPDVTVRSAGSADEMLGDHVAIWPKEAYATGKDGTVTLHCLINVHGLAEWCRVAAEAPPGQGFGRAALELKPTFKLKPAVGPDGQPTPKVMSINVGFRNPDFRHAGDDLARNQWLADHNPGMTLATVQKPTVQNRMQMRSVTMVDNPVWIAAASFDDVARAYPAKGGGAEGYGAAHCQVVRDGPEAGLLKRCQVLKEAPRDHDFGSAAVSLAGKFRLDATALPGAPTGAPLWVDIPVRFAPPAAAADRTVSAPVWLTKIDLAKAAPIVFPLKALEAGLASGQGTARCAVGADGSLVDCAPDAAAPEGWGFSEAVVKLATNMRVNLWSADGAPVLGGVVRLPLTLALPGGDGTDR